VSDRDDVEPISVDADVVYFEVGQKVSGPITDLFPEYFNANEPTARMGSRMVVTAVDREAGVIIVRSDSDTGAKQ
jgi:hypothetical protein